MDLKEEQRRGLNKLRAGIAFDDAIRELDRLKAEEQRLRLKMFLLVTFKYVLPVLIVTLFMWAMTR